MSDLNQAITFAILLGVLHYTFMSINIVMFRNKWPVGSIRRGYTHPFHPLPAFLLFVLCVVTVFAIFPCRRRSARWIEARGYGHHRLSEARGPLR